MVYVLIQVHVAKFHVDEIVMGISELSGPQKGNDVRMPLTVARQFLY
jgi:hypothetical protein